MVLQALIVHAQAQQPSHENSTFNVLYLGDSILLLYH